MANAGQRTDWNGEIGLRWTADADRRDHVLAPIAELLIGAARIGRGESVLDVGCGCGAVTIEAALSAGLTGRVVGIDLSGLMLGVARRRASERQIANVTFVQADAQTHPLPAAAFDVAVSRFGTMFFDDPVAAFTNIAAALRPGARLCLITWQPLTANEWLTVPAAALAPHAATPGGGGELTGTGGSADGPAAGPGMFAQSDPAALAVTLQRAGFAAVSVTAVTVAIPLGADPAEAASYLVASGPSRVALESIPGEHRPAAIESVTEALRERATADGVRLNAALWLTTASCAAGDDGA